MTDLIYWGLLAQTIGSLLLLGGYAPQILKLFKTGNPTGISLLFWVMIATGCTAISVNMYIQDAPFEIQLTQGLNAFFALFTLILVFYYKTKNKDVIKVNFIATGVALMIVGFMITFISKNDLNEIGLAFQTIGTVALLTAYLPQIFHLYKVKDATGISKWLFVVLGTGLSFVTINMIITSTSIEIIITEFVNIALILILYAMTVYYQNKQ